MHNKDVGQGEETIMGKCLDLTSCGFENREKARFCARCGIPTRGVLLRGRYEIHALAGKERCTVILQAIDRYGNQPVTVRALIPRETDSQERDNFLQDAEMAASLSEKVQDPESIRVIDYGQDGPVAFLVKTDYQRQEQRTTRPHRILGTGGDMRESAAPYTAQATNFDDDQTATQLRISVPTKSSMTTPRIPTQISQQRQHTSVPLQRDWVAEGNRAYEKGNYQD